MVGETVKRDLLFCSDDGLVSRLKKWWRAVPISFIFFFLLVSVGWRLMEVIQVVVGFYTIESRLHADPAFGSAGKVEKKEVRLFLV